MQANQTPTLVPLPFAANGTKNTIPEASQIGITPGAASLNDGFPPLTFTPIAAGGVPPAGADFNGVLNLITQSIRWAHAGGRYTFSSTFSGDANVTGYPAGAVLMSADQQGAWLSLNDNNTDNPDTGPGTKWVPSHAYGITAVSGLASSNVTLTPAQALKPKITLAGTLTANVQVIFPTWTRDWTVVNNTTGSFTVTAKTASGTGIVLAAGQQRITGDGTNIVQPAESIASATQAQHALQKQQKGLQTFTSSGTFTVPPGVTQIFVSGCAAGGGGGGAAGNSGTANNAGGGTGGGAGQSLLRVGYTVTPGQSISITIGAAGAHGNGGAAGANNGQSGTAGGNTLIGSLATLAGGGGGGGGLISGGGSPSTGFPAGGLGFDGAAFGAGGCGGTSAFGGGGGNSRGTSTSGGGLGQSAAGYGAGGGGGGAVYSALSSAGGNGGDGTQGYVQIEW